MQLTLSSIGADLLRQRGRHACFIHIQVPMGETELDIQIPTYLDRSLQLHDGRHQVLLFPTGPSHGNLTTALRGLCQ